MGKCTKCYKPSLFHFTNHDITNGLLWKWDTQHTCLCMKHEIFVLLFEFINNFWILRLKVQALVMCFLHLIVLSMTEEYLYL